MPKGLNRAYAVVCLVVICMLVNGCNKPREGTRLMSSPTTRNISQGMTLTIVDPPLGHRTASPVAASTPILDGSHASTARKPSRFRDHTNGTYPPSLPVIAETILESPIADIWRIQNDWSSKKLFMVTTHQHTTGIFMERDGRYIYVNSGAELIAINEVLREYRFTRQDFADPEKVQLLLDEVAFLHRGPRVMPVSSFTLRGMKPMVLDSWLQGTEKSETVFKQLCHDPDFVFVGNRWSVKINVFKADGAVDQWKLIGQHDPQVNANEIWRIDIAGLKPPGTFSWALSP